MTDDFKYDPNAWPHDLYWEWRGSPEYKEVEEKIAKEAKRPWGKIAKCNAIDEAIRILNAVKARIVSTKSIKKFNAKEWLGDDNPVTPKDMKDLTNIADEVNAIVDDILPALTLSPEIINKKATITKKIDELRQKYNEIHHEAGQLYQDLHKNREIWYNQAIDKFFARRGEWKPNDNSDKDDTIEPDYKDEKEYTVDDADKWYETTWGDAE